VGSNPTPGTYIIHTSHARHLRFWLFLLLLVREPQPDFEVLLIGQPLHSAHLPGEHLALVLRLAVSKNRSELGGMLAEPAKGRKGVVRRGVQQGPDSFCLIARSSL
jgi:hypothetical protein